MLPDFPEVKDKLLEFWTRWTQKRQQEYLGFFSEVPIRSSHEGERWQIDRSDGSSSLSEYDHIQANMTVHADEVPSLFGKKLAEKLDQIAFQFADQMEGNIFRTLNKELEDAGQVKDVRGREFDKEMFLEMLGSMNIDFDIQGDPLMPTVLVSPNISGGIMETLKEAEKDSEHNRKLDLLIEKKREEWRARENSRKLVD